MFQESVGSLDPILGEVERDIERLVLSDAASLDEGFLEYEAGLERRVREAREKERTLADFVLDRASLRHDLATELLEQSPLARWSDLEQFAARCLPYFGGTLKDHFEGGQVVSLSPRLMSRMQQRQSTIRGTFDPEVARDKEELPFFAFGHWLVDGLAELPLSVEPVDHCGPPCSRRSVRRVGRGLLRDPRRRRQAERLVPPAPGRPRSRRPVRADHRDARDRRAALALRGARAGPAAP